MGQLFNFKCSACKNVYEDRTIRISRGMRTTLQTCVCNDCKTLFEISGIEKISEEETNFNEIKKNKNCKNCNSNNYSLWDKKCPNCETEITDVTFGSLWD